MEWAYEGKSVVTRGSRVMRRSQTCGVSSDDEQSQREMGQKGNGLLCLLISNFLLQDL